MGFKTDTIAAISTAMTNSGIGIAGRGAHRIYIKKKQEE